MEDGSCLAGKGIYNEEESVGMVKLADNREFRRKVPGTHSHEKKSGSLG